MPSPFPEWIVPPPPGPEPAAATPVTEPAVPAPSEAPVRRRRSPRMIAAAAVVALVAGFVALGGHLPIGDDGTTTASPSTSVRPILPTTPAAPTTPTAPASPGSTATTSPGAPGAGSTAASTTGRLSDDEVEAIGDKVRLGIVDIETVIRFGRGRGAGTGMILTSDGEILTNNHVIENATSIRVTVVATGRTYAATVVGTVPGEDVAVVDIDAEGLTPIAVGRSDEVTPGDPVVALGNAGGRGGTQPAVAGLVQGVNETITASERSDGADAQTLHGLIASDAPIEPGDSGGPLANDAGEVVGMNSAASVGGRFNRTATAGFAIPIDNALSLVERIRDGEASDTVRLGLPGFLGVGLPTTGAASAAGVVIEDVTDGLPADEAGIEPGAVITSIGGRAVRTPDELSAAIRSYRAGDRVTIAWIDGDGEAASATVTLAPGPAD